MTRLHSTISALFDSLSNADEEEIDDSGDVAPGSMEAPQMLPKASAHGSGVFQSLCSLFRGGNAEKDYGYEGKELELRRPEGMKHWGGSH
jgi:hypothetical protein